MRQDRAALEMVAKIHRLEKNSIVITGPGFLNHSSPLLILNTSSLNLTNSPAFLIQAFLRDKKGSANAPWTQAQLIVEIGSPTVPTIDFRFSIYVLLGSSILGEKY